MIGSTLPYQDTWSDTAKYCGEAVKSCVTRTWRAVQNTFVMLAKMKDDSNTLAKLLKLSGFVILGVHYTLKGPSLSALKSRVSNAESLIDTFQIFGDIKYLVTGSAAKDWNRTDYNAKIKVFSSLGFFGVNTGGFFMWLDDLKVVDLGKWASSLGKCQVFRPLVNIGLGNIVRAGVGFSFGLMGIDAILRLKTVDSNHEEGSVYINQALIDLGWAVAEIAFSIFMLTSGMSLGMAVFGGIALTMGCWSFVHRQLHEDVLDAPIPGIVA